MTFTSIIAEATDKMPTLHIAETVTEQSTYAVARLLMSLSSWLIKTLHLPKTDDAFVVVYALVVFAVAFAVGWVVKTICVFILRHISFKNKLSLYDILVGKHIGYPIIVVLVRSEHISVRFHCHYITVRIRGHYAECVVPPPDHPVCAPESCVGKRRCMAYREIERRVTLDGKLVYRDQLAG